MRRSRKDPSESKYPNLFTQWKEDVQELLWNLFCSSPPQFNCILKKGIPLKMGEQVTQIEAKKCWIPKLLTPLNPCRKFLSISPIGSPCKIVPQLLHPFGPSKTTKRIMHELYWSKKNYAWTPPSYLVQPTPNQGEKMQCHCTMQVRLISSLYCSSAKGNKCPKWGLYKVLVEVRHWCLTLYVPSGKLTFWLQEPSRSRQSWSKRPGGRGATRERRPS